LDATEPHLENREWQNNFVLGTWRIFAAQEDPQSSPDFQNPLLASFDGILSATWVGGRLGLVAVKSPDQPPLGVYSAADPSTFDVASHASHIVSDLITVSGLDRLPRSFNGNRALCYSVAEAVAKHLHLSITIDTDFRAAVVTNVTFIDTPISEHHPHRLPFGHRIIPADLEKNNNALFDQFARVIDVIPAKATGRPLPLMPSTPVQWQATREKAQKYISSGTVWAYLIGDETTAVALGFVGRPTRRGIHIRIVYTEKVHRRQGYAERLVREMVRHALHEEKREYVSIFYVAGRSAGAVYKRVGFGTGEADEYERLDLELVSSEGS